MSTPTAGDSAGKNSAKRKTAGPGSLAPDGLAPEVGENLSYEQARNELREIVSALESGGQPLEQSLALWQRGEKLAAICQRWLDGARARLDAAIEASDAD